MKNTTKIVTVWELYQQSMPKSHIENHLSINRETAGIWIKKIEKNGL